MPNQREALGLECFYALAVGLGFACNELSSRLIVSRFYALAVGLGFACRPVLPLDLICSLFLCPRCRAGLCMGCP